MDGLVDGSIDGLMDGWLSWLYDWFARSSTYARHQATYWRHVVIPTPATQPQSMHKSCQLVLSTLRVTDKQCLEQSLVGPKSHNCTNARNIHTIITVQTWFCAPEATPMLRSLWWKTFWYQTLKALHFFESAIYRGVLFIADAIVDINVDLLIAPVAELINGLESCPQ